MSKEILKFPDGFLWGSATSAYQVEGGIENNDWVETGRKGSVPLALGTCDHYNRYVEDFDIAKSLNQNAYRFSIEWSRIEPEEGKWDLDEVKHYRQVLIALRERSIEPFVTIWHFTLPIWFSRIGGWENKRSPRIFTRYAEFIFSQLKDLAKFWIVMNEPSVYVGEGYLRKTWPPHKKSLLAARVVSNNLARAHKLAFLKIKKQGAEAKAGIAEHFVYFLPANLSYLDKILVKFLRKLEGRFLEKTRGCYDFIGLNYYRPRHIKFNFRKWRDFFIEDKPQGELTDIGWEIFPEGIYYILQDLQKYKLPIYVTENGIADEKDLKREKYIKDHLFQIHRAIQEGTDVRGYFYWSLLDNFEWTYGFSKRFGLVEVNFLTQERKIRESAYQYAKICKSNAL